MGQRFSGEVIQKEKSEPFVTTSNEKEQRIQQQSEVNLLRFSSHAEEDQPLRLFLDQDGSGVL